MHSSAECVGLSGQWLGKQLGTLAHTDSHRENKSLLFCTLQQTLLDFQTQDDQSTPEVIARLVGCLARPGRALEAHKHDKVLVSC